jgi:hypothetical protein
MPLLITLSAGRHNELSHLRERVSNAELQPGQRTPWSHPDTALYRGDAVNVWLQTATPPDTDTSQITLERAFRIRLIELSKSAACGSIDFIWTGNQLGGMAIP